MNKKVKTIFIALAAVMLFAACTPSADEQTKGPESIRTEGPQTRDEVMLSLKDAVPANTEGAGELQLKFNLALLKKLGELEDGSLFFSPMSISTALTMAYFGAAGKTQEQMADVLGYSDMSMIDVASYQKYLLQSYEDSGETTFTTANSVWIDDMFEARQSYMDTMNDVFQTKVTKLDLQAEDAADKLNAWIGDATDGMIKGLFEKGDDSLAEAVMVLMNAIYFKGEWTVPFDPEKTYDSTFNGATETSDVKMMSSDETVMGHQGEDYTSVYLPYGEDEHFAMVAVLPDDMASFVGGLTVEALSDMLSTFEEKEDPMLQFPVFEMEKKVELNDVLKSLGIELAFSENADFSQMSEVPILIDEVLHKAKIKVDEEGAEAAAVTAVITNECSAADRFEFIANKPFLFFIVDTQNDLVLFTGKVLDLN